MSEFWDKIPTIGGLKAEPITYLIDGFIPVGSFVLLSGRSGSYKSFLALDMCRAVAMGGKFVGLETERRDVLYIDRENGYNLIASRKDLVGIPEGVETFRYLGQWVEGVNTGPPDSPQMLAFADKHRPLVVFDSLIRFGIANENDNAAMARLMGQFLRLSRAGATVILIHHASYGTKDGPQKAYRGATEIEAAPDICYEVVRDKGSTITLLRAFKNRFYEERRYTFIFDKGRFQWAHQ